MQTASVVEFPRALFHEASQKYKKPLRESEK